MYRHAIAVVFVATTVLTLAQGVSASQPVSPSSDPLAVSLVQKALKAMTGGALIGDVTLNANVISIIGADYETGTATLRAKGTSESRVDVNLATGGTRTDVRNVNNGIPSGAWQVNGASVTPYAAHNCWTDATWFAPGLSSLTQTGNANLIVKYIGQVQHGGVTTQHIQLYQWSAQAPTTLGHLSSMDFYLDAVSFLPLAVSYNVHPDVNMDQDIPVEIDFANYQPINGVLVPFHIAEIYNGSVILDLTVTNALFNTGLPDTLFTLP